MKEEQEKNETRKMQKKEKFKKKRGGEKEQIKIRQPLKGK
jgi:hypothetical protein